MRGPGGQGQRARDFDPLPPSGGRRRDRCARNRRARDAHVLSPKLFVDRWELDLPPTRASGSARRSGTPRCRPSARGGKGAALRASSDEGHLRRVGQAFSGSVVSGFGFRVLLFVFSVWGCGLGRVWVLVPVFGLPVWDSVRDLGFGIAVCGTGWRAQPHKPAPGRRFRQVGGTGLEPVGTLVADLRHPPLRIRRPRRRCRCPARTGSRAHREPAEQRQRAWPQRSWRSRPTAGRRRLRASGPPGALLGARWARAGV